MLLTIVTVELLNIRHLTLRLIAPTLFNVFQKEIGSKNKWQIAPLILIRKFKNSIKTSAIFPTIKKCSIGCTNQHYKRVQ